MKEDIYVKYKFVLIKYVEIIIKFEFCQIKFQMVLLATLRKHLRVLKKMNNEKINSNAWVKSLFVMTQNCYA